MKKILLSFILFLSIISSTFGDIISNESFPFPVDVANNNPKIPVRTSDGLHALLIQQSTGSYSLALWKNKNDIILKSISSDIMSGIPSVDIVNLEFLNNDLIMSGGWPTKVMKLSITNDVQVLSTFYNGSDKSRWGASCSLTNGGVFLVNYVDSNPDNTSIIDAIYLYNDKVFTNHIVFASNTGSDLPYMIVAIQNKDDGLVNVFYTRDSASAVGLIRYRITENGLELVDYNIAFIPQNSPLHIGIQGEFPRIFAIYDAINHRILLCYQTYPHTYSPCYNLLTSPTSIVSVNKDNTLSLVSEFDTPSLHISFPYQFISLLNNQILFQISYYDTNACVEGLLAGHVDVNGIPVISDYTTRGKVFGYSEDGWTLATDNYVYFLMKHGATSTVTNIPPFITSNPQGQNIQTGQTLSLSVSANGTTPLNYQWYINNANILGATQDSYIKSNAQTNDSGDYYVNVSNIAGSVNSAVATITVTNPAPIPTPVIVLNTVTNLAVKQVNTTLSLTWTDNSINEDRYMLEYTYKKTNGFPPYQILAILPANTQSYSFAPLKRYNYNFRIRACKAENCALYSNIASIRTK